MTLRDHVPALAVKLAVPWFLWLAACASASATRAPDLPEAGSLSKYRRVYMPAVDAAEDPRNVVPKVMEHLRKLGLEVRTFDQEEGPGSQGTGFLVGAGLVVTCAHVLGDNDVATLWLDGKRAEAKVERRDEAGDLALLRMSSSESLPPALSIRSEASHSLGQEVFTIGFPLTDILGTSPRLTKGHISATVGIEDDPRMLQVSAEIQPGNSGGPLLDARGEVVGVMSATLNPAMVLMRTGGSLPQNVNFAIKSEALRLFLADAGVQLEPVSPPGDEPFERVSHSVALVRAGYVPPEEERVEEMLCTVRYVSMWDLWYRFQEFQVQFHDLRTGKLLLTAGQHGDNMFSTENGVIARTFKEIEAAFAAAPAAPPPSP